MLSGAEQGKEVALCWVTAAGTADPALPLLPAGEG